MPPPAPKSKRMPYKSYDLREIVIVLVERKYELREMMADVLKMLGAVNVFQCSSFERAMDIVLQNPVDIVITDWAPSLDATQFIKKIRSLPGRKSFTPIIVATAFTGLGHLRQAQDAGMTEFLARPISAKLLYSRICAIIESERKFVRVGRFFGPDRRRSKRSQFEGAERRLRKP